MRPDLLSDLIRALATGDWDAVDILLAEIGRPGWGGSLYLIGAAFAVAVGDHFGDASTPNDVAAFVSTARAEHQVGDSLPTLEMEGLIRAALGEPELIDNISGETALDVELFVLVYLLRMKNLTPAELDKLIAEAEALVARVPAPAPRQKRSRWRRWWLRRRRHDQ
ncbi:hypothetical protein [Micromonospora zamorensis]|uniref:hypothetical protein n=1 Tax=Micromonospora zamorensis TaxID=709883 RepID=UPI0033A0BBEB|nr:hypothetical protein OHA01_31295 [Micromonospora zamorensis]